MPSSWASKGDGSEVNAMSGDDYAPHRFFRAVEVVAVIGTGLARFIVAEWLEFDLFFIVCAIAFWIGFVLVRTRSEEGVLQRWGFTWRRNPKQARILVPYFAALLIACYLWGRVGLGGNGPQPFGVDRGHFVTTLLLYPFWGVVQQFIVVAMIAGNIGLILKKPSRRGPIAVLATGILFALAHLPSPALVALGFLLGAVATSTYLRWRNLWIIGLFHGWVATFFYYFVLRQDPWDAIVALARSPW